MHLAMGFMEEYALLWSIHVKEGIRSEEVAKTLNKVSAEANCCKKSPGLWPDQIFMIKNGKKGPEVFTRYVAGTHYPEQIYDGSLLESWKNYHISPE